MNARQASGVVRWVSLVAVLALASAAAAFQAAGGGAGGDIGRGGPRQGDKASDTGSGKATISRFMPPREGQDDGLGSLMVKTDEGKTLRLEIRPKDNIKLMVGNHEVTTEDYEKFLLPGLALNIGWATDKLGSRKTQYVSSLTFETVQIEGRITGIDEESADIIKVFAKPAGDRKWPELKKPPVKKTKPPKSGGGGGSPGGGIGGGSKPKSPPPPPKEKPVQAKPLRLRYFDGVSNLTDSSKQPLSVGDLRDYKDQQISATVVFGARGECVLIEAQIEGDRPEKTSDASGGGGDRGR